ncbi:MAG TPA: glucokinase [Blastocatellia bacterium]|nr:glucokinase [Blastocatellia bacterium]
MILAGDIGGTKTNLGLFDAGEGSLRLLKQQSFPSRENTGLESIVSRFMEGEEVRPAAACFGVAGPVLNGQSVTPNLPWVVDSDSVARTLGLESVSLINDLEAMGHGIAELKPGEMLALNQGAAVEGNAALVAAGTGLGVASLFWNGRKHLPSASEGGHADFAPRNQLEIELLLHMQTKHSRVSCERVLSGPGLFNIYDFLRASGYAEEDKEIAEAFRTNDPSSVISKAALANRCKMCVKALDMFAAIYGAVAGNIALTLKAVGGVYIGGGIAPKILEKLKDGTFVGAFMDKGRLSPLLATIPVRVILNDKTPLLGAARVAAESL